MPTRERRPRRRVKAREVRIRGEGESLNEEARNATPEHWDNGLRRRFVRYLTDHRGLTPDIAAGIVRAYELKPMYIPMRPPRKYLKPESP